MSFIQKLERRFGKYAIKNLTRYIIIAYVIGYVLQIIGQYSGSYIQYFIGLNPDMILHGQIWRIVSWLLIPPSNLSVFTIIMLFCYYQLGTVLEKVWGDFMYNFYIFFGIICTIIGAFVLYAIVCVVDGANAPIYGFYTGLGCSTYYVSLSIFLGFAMTFPDQSMLLFLIIPIKIKYLAILDVAYLTYYIIVGNWITRMLIISSLAATILFFLMTRKQKFQNAYQNAQNRKRQQQFQQAMSRGQATAAYRHKCHICGQTEKDNPDLEFRYCSKCNGNYEYCQNHLFTHEHIK